MLQLRCIKNQAMRPKSKQKTRNKKQFKRLSIDQSESGFSDTSPKISLVWETIKTVISDLLPSRQRITTSWRNLSYLGKWSLFIGVVSALTAFGGSAYDKARFTWPEAFTLSNKGVDAAIGEIIAINTFKLPLDKNKSFSLGHCPGKECIEVTLGELDGKEGFYKQVFNLRGDPFGVDAKRYSVSMFAPTWVTGSEVRMNAAPGIYTAADPGLDSGSSINEGASGELLILATSMDISNPMTGRPSIEVSDPYISVALWLRYGRESKIVMESKVAQITFEVVDFTIDNMTLRVTTRRPNGAYEKYLQESRFARIMGG